MVRAIEVKGEHESGKEINEMEGYQVEFASNEACLEDETGNSKFTFHLNVICKHYSEEEKKEFKNLGMRDCCAHTALSYQ